MRLIALAATLVTVFALTACGDDSNDGTTTGVEGNDRGSLGPPTVLTFTYKATDTSKTRTARLTCTEREGASASGYLPADDAVQFCKDVDSRSKLLIESPDRTKACAQIYGGPQTLEVSGRVDFKTVDQTFKRTNSCEIADWKTLAPLLPPRAPT